MDILTLVLIIVAIVALSGWGYGRYAYRPAVYAPAPVVASPGWVSPLGVIGLLVVIGLVIMFVTGWRPIVIGP